MTALGRILVVRRFACPTNWWASAKAKRECVFALCYRRCRLRRHRHEMIYFNISETTEASKQKNLHSIPLGSLYIFAGNDVASYFRSAVNRINVFILGSSWGRDLSVTVQPIPKKFTVLETGIQGISHFKLLTNSGRQSKTLF